ncbi:hypothetical protein MMC13_000034 [Lambiella insularis]|nr:hypothetical protein [Lambiella insularis]
MAPALKKRKLSAATTHNVARSTQYGNINAFGRVSKSASALQASKTAELLGKDGVFHKTHDLGTSWEGVSKKRRIELLETPAKEQIRSIVLETEVVEAHQAPSCTKNTALQSPSLPVKPRKKAAPRAKHLETPTKGARAFLEAFALCSSSPSTLPSSPLPTSKETPPTSPVSAKSPCPLRLNTGLPSELQDLIDLHSSFLTALSLHYAHNGSFSPVDLRVLKPSIERAWGKRSIGSNDVRSILGILSSGESSARQDTEAQCPIALSDYGRGKICIEINGSIPPNGLRRRPIDVEKLNARFLENITQLWTAQSSTDVTAFLSDLPRAPITTCSSLRKISPLLAKGQRRLEDLKSGAIKAQLSNSPSKTAVPSQPHSSPKLPSSRSSSLLERIQAKELYQSTLPCAPSSESIARRSALQRLEEIMPVLEILTSSTSRSDCACETEIGNENKVFSFTMPTVVQHLQMSLRNPICKDEAVRCIALLAEEVAPGWIGIKDVGKLKGVTVRRGKGMGREEMMRRIREAMGVGLS